MQFTEDFYEAFLKNILCVVSMARVSSAQAHQSGFEKIVKRTLCFAFISFAAVK
jgi:hypothetical protein